MKETSILRTILTALISIAVTVIGGLLLYYFQSKQPELIYKVDKILPFESQTQKLNIYHITIENTGNQIAEDVVCQIQITPATVKEYRVNSDAPIQIIDSVKKQDIDINTSSLNPKESYKVSILATSEGAFPDEPLVKIRAKGISGTEKKIDSENHDEKDSNFLLKLLLEAASVATAMTLFTRYILSDDGTRHSGNQNEILSYLCGIHGLDAQVERYLALPKKTSYWAEMDRLAAIAIASNDTTIALKSITIIDDLIKYADMASTSKGVGYYNLARLYLFINDIPNCNSNLEIAKKTIPKLLATRLEIDPIFKNHKWD